MFNCKCSSWEGKIMILKVIKIACKKPPLPTPLTCLRMCVNYTEIWDFFAALFSTHFFVYQQQWCSECLVIYEGGLWKFWNVINVQGRSWMKGSDMTLWSVENLTEISTYENSSKRCQKALKNSLNWCKNRWIPSLPQTSKILQIYLNKFS